MLAGPADRADDARSIGAVCDDDMTAGDQNHPDPLRPMLLRSDALHERLNELLDESTFDGSARGEAALGMCLVAMEHVTTLRALMALGLPTSAVSFMRLQFDALTRSMWLIYAASDAAVETLRRSADGFPVHLALQVLRNFKRTNSNV